jgi:ring-1,2-phenylacetyl-CoA epoxidase subunit PaaE
MSQLYALPLVAKKQETDEAVSLSFLIPDGLKEIFAYKAGQYLTLEVEVNGEKLRRAYSLCSCPITDDQLTVTVKKVEGGRVSTLLNGALQLGQNIQVMPPEGRFTPEINVANKKHYFLFAGGSGITPMMSIIRTVLKAEPDCIISLIYANRNKHSVIFKDDLDLLVKKESSRFQVVYAFDKADFFWTGGIKGQLTRDVVKKQVSKLDKPGLDNQFYICGPGGMMDVVRGALTDLGIDADRIHIEYFTAPVSAGNDTISTPSAGNASLDGTLLHLTLNGKTHDLQVKAKKTILAAAQDAGLDPPYSCEAGICSTCMAKVTAGKVRMIQNNILTEKEVANGYVLTCQALCESADVSVVYYD